ncbi:MAG: VanW family protein [Nocardioides sp.]|jgi:vancomycin resistance protein YoaR
MRDASEQKKEKKGYGAVFFVVTMLLALGAGGYVAAWYFANDRTPHGTVVDGIRLGGMTHDKAIKTLQDGLAERAEQPYDIQVGAETERATADEFGLSVDYEATVDEAGAQRSWDPEWLWHFYTGGDDIEAVKAVDDTDMDAFLSRLADTVDKPAKDGAVKFRPDGFKVDQAVDGVELDRATARTALRDAFLGEDTDISLQVETVKPDIDAAAVQRAVDEFANPAMSAPVTVRFGQAEVRLKPSDYATALSLEPKNGELTPTLDAEVLGEKLSGLVSGNAAPVDASIRLVNGKPVITDSKPGVTYDPADLNKRFLKLVTRPEDKREIKVKSTVAEPEFTTQDAKALGIKEQVSTFTTYYPHADYRNINIGRAAELVNGTVLEPGEIFSLNDTVGERTVANGFTEGYIISNGILVQDLGGGVSQMATTTFNAMFFAGLKDIEHKPHSFYIDRYPVGREATVAWGAVDLRFQNDTPYGIYISAHVTPSTYSSSGVVTVSMYSTKMWNITTSNSERYNFTQPKVRKIDTQKCHPNTGYGGFEINVYRNFAPVAPNTETRARETFHTTYTPSDTVICTHPNPVD